MNSQQTNASNRIRGPPLQKSEKHEQQRAKRTSENANVRSSVVSELGKTLKRMKRTNYRNEERSQLYVSSLPKTKPPSVLVQCDKGTEFSVSENAFTSERKNYSQDRKQIGTLTADECGFVRGNLQVTGQIMQPSDIKVVEVTEKVDTIQQLKNVSQMQLYRYLHTKEYAQYGGLPDQRAKSVGVLAQELETILPDAITKAPDINFEGGKKMEGPLFVNKDRLLMESLGAIQELCKMTDSLKKRLFDLEAKKSIPEMILFNATLRKDRKADIQSEPNSCESVDSLFNMKTILNKSQSRFQRLHFEGKFKTDKIDYNPHLGHI